MGRFLLFLSEPVKHPHANERSRPYTLAARSFAQLAQRLAVQAYGDAQPPGDANIGGRKPSPKSAEPPLPADSGTRPWDHGRDIIENSHPTTAVFTVS